MFALLAYVYFFVVPSDAALALPIPPKVRSQNAAHTTETRNYFQKWLTPYHIPTYTHQ